MENIIPYLLIGIAVIIMLGLTVVVLGNVSEGSPCEGLEGKGITKYESKSIEIPDTFGRAIAKYTFTNQAGQTSELVITVKEAGDYAGTFTLKSDRNTEGVSVQISDNGNVFVTARMQGAQSVTTAEVTAAINGYNASPVTINWSDAIQLRTPGGHEVRTGLIIGFTNEIIPGEVTETIVEIFTHDEGWYKVCIDLQQQQINSMILLAVIIIVVVAVIIIMALKSADVL